jgi:hypothetical protein
MNKEKILGFLRDTAFLVDDGIDGVEYNADASAEDLHTVAQTATREQRWAAFLASARRVNPVRFDLQRENKEFVVIPESFK